MGLYEPVVLFCRSCRYPRCYFCYTFPKPTYFIRISLSDSNGCRWVKWKNAFKPSCFPNDKSYTNLPSAHCIILILSLIIIQNIGTRSFNCLLCITDYLYLQVLWSSSPHLGCSTRECLWTSSRPGAVKRRTWLLCLATASLELSVTRQVCAVYDFLSSFTFCRGCRIFLVGGVVVVK